MPESNHSSSPPSNPPLVGDKSRKRLGDRLVELGRITAAQLVLALEEQKRTGENVGQVLLRLAFVREEDLAQMLAEDLGVPFVRLQDQVVEPLANFAMDIDFLTQVAAVPLREEKGMVVLAMARPSDVTVLDTIQRQLKKPLKVLAATETEIRALLRLAPVQAGGKSLTSVGQEGAAAQLDAILARALREGSTDVHIEPEERLVRLRFRVDGMLRSVEMLPVESGAAVVARVKVLAQLDIAEHRRPQDGRFRTEIAGRAIDLRVSTIPARHGENTVLRILDRSSAATRIDQLGLPTPMLTRLKAIGELPYGLLLVTGPTGSGKTTTLYSLLASIDALARKVATIEDPIEAEIPLVRQSQVDTSIGFGFAEGLRSLLRQDPDVLLVGEIRDRETADIALRASLTGHLVLATLHTNDALGAAPRLIEMGIEPFLLSASLAGVLAQRLVRRVCRACAVEVEPGEDDRLLFDGAPPPRVVRGQGCAQCSNSGHRGRLGIYELFEPDTEFKRVLLAQGDDVSMRAVATKRGFEAMTFDGREKVRAGVTTSAEVLRVTRVID
ncbi:MAG: type II/IV secretion system protein [Planctomycetes bacterium]|nr:type II/IV secretion system protein [Planctomycetota bacterium]MCC7169211.1 type II/IV secretion system protein [Planctomycetota bacterium]